MDIKVFQNIDPGDYKVTPFVATKTITTGDGSYTNVGLKMFRGVYKQVRFQENGFYLHNISSSAYSRDSKSVVYGLTSDGDGLDTNYHFIKHRFYASPSPYESFGGNDDREERFLGSRVQLLSVPYNLCGEGISPGTVSVVDQSSTNDRTFRDDTFGNLIDTAVTNLAPSSSLITHFNFNGEFVDGINYGLEYKNTGNKIGDYKETNDKKGVVGKQGEDADLRLYNILYEDGKWGMSSGFDGSTGYGKVPDSHKFDFPQEHDFAIATWVKMPISQSIVTNASNFLIGKNGNLSRPINENVGGENSENQPGIISESFVEAPNFPFELTTFNQSSANVGKIQIARKGGLFTPSTMTTQSFNDGNWHHVVAQRKTGSLEIYVDGRMHASSSDSTNGNTRNMSDMFVASRGLGGNSWDDSFSGSIDDIRLYSSSLSYNEIQNLYTNPSGTNKIGNVFYKDGTIAVTNPSSSYDNVFISTGSNGWDVTFDNKVTYYQYETTCNIREGQFMVSNNPTLRKNNDVNSEFYKDFTTGSFFEPYITTIGLYNDDYQLVAIGKLAKPLPNTKDIAYTISVRFDV